MGLICLPVVHLLQCRSSLCLHPMSGLLLTCIASIIMATTVSLVRPYARSICSVFLCLWCQMPWWSRQTINNQLVIKLWQFTQEELDSVLRKTLNRRATGLMKYPHKYGRPGNSMTYCSDTIMQYIIKNTIERWTKGCIPPSLRRASLD